MTPLKLTYLVALSLALGPLAVSRALTTDQEKPYVLVRGEANKPGMIPFTEGMTVRHAVVLFEGPSSTASLARAFIIRKQQLSGRQEVIPVDLGAVMQGKNEDLPILVDDIIFIREFGVGARP